MQPFILKVKVYCKDNLPTIIATGIFSGIGILIIWTCSFLWDANTEKIANREHQARNDERLTEIAESSNSTAKSMQEFVIFVKEDRIEINNLKRRVADLEEYKIKHDAEVQDFWKNYYYSPNKKGK